MGEGMFGTTAAAAHSLASFTLNRDWIVLSCTTSAAPWVGAVVNRRLWDAFAPAEAVFRPLYEQAWAAGTYTGRVFYNGVLVDLHCETTADDHLVVSFWEVDHLDITSVDSLVESLRRLLASAQEPARHETAPQDRRRLQAVPVAAV